MQGPRLLSQVEIDNVSFNLGNNTKCAFNNLNANLNMEMLYKYLGLSKKIVVQISQK
jgi:hypothetical protein